MSTLNAFAAGMSSQTPPASSPLWNAATISSFTSSLARSNVSAPRARATSSRPRAARRQTSRSSGMSAYWKPSSPPAGGVAVVGQSGVLEAVEPAGVELGVDHLEHRDPRLGVLRGDDVAERAHRRLLA